jgi:hypothetical protein
MVDFNKINYERKLKELGKRYETMKREADTKKGALLNTVENMKAEHGIGTADEAKAMIKDLEAKVAGWETERDKLVEQIDTALNGGQASGIESLEDKYGEDPDDDSFETDDDEFDDFEAD